MTIATVGLLRGVLMINEHTVEMMGFIFPSPAEEKMGAAGGLKAAGDFVSSSCNGYREASNGATMTFDEFFKLCETALAKV